MLAGGSRKSAGYSKKPKVSIITVVLNGGKFIDAYLQNVLGFLTNDIELVMIDGGSKDKTLDAIKRHNQAIDYWCSEPDAGIYEAMNKGLTHAKGNWFYFMGVDDLLLHDFPAMLTLLNGGCSIYYGNVITYDKVFSRVYDSYFLTKLNICHQAIFYPRAVFNKYQYDTAYNVYADYHLNLQCWHDPAFTFVHCNLLIASFAGGGVSTHTRDLKFEQDRDWLFKKYLGTKVYYRYLNRTKGALQVVKNLISK